HEVFIGSREEEKACEASDRMVEVLLDRGLASSCTGLDNQAAVDASELVILAIPFKHVAVTLEHLTGFEGKIVVSPVNPIEKTDCFYYTPPPEGSAAMLIKRLLLDGARICAAFNNIAANRWKALDEPLRYSVAVCGDDAEAKRAVMDLVASVPDLKPLDGGPLKAASMVESITPVLLNIAKFNKMRDVGVQFK
ncbi:MAG TPA: NADPH-dependent F420 reductase, partial [Methanomicrobiales archaeon]|nr:NADPH-dependent F420 reductase [Methanomicrobiales archaeon]